jgi:uncharacterized protein YjgD (DUF1641 family)
MAQPITLHRNSNGATHAEANRPTVAAQHADAVESAYELLQLLHDRGVLTLLRGLLGAGDRVIDTLVEAVDTPESIRAIRNFLLLTKFFSNIPPEVLNSLAQAATEGARREKSHRAPGFFELYRKLRNENTRHALAVTLDLLESVGKGL